MLCHSGNSRQGCEGAETGGGKRGRQPGVLHSHLEGQGIDLEVGTGKEQDQQGGHYRGDERRNGGARAAYQSWTVPSMRRL